MEHHSGEGHASLMSAHTIRQLVEEVRQQSAGVDTSTQLLLDAMVGPRNRLTGIRDTEKGVLFKVDAMWRAAMNGGRGMKARLGAWERVGIALIAGLSTVLAAWLSRGF